MLLENDPILDKWILQNFKFPFSYILDCKRNVYNNTLYNSIRKLKETNLPVEIIEYTSAEDFERLKDAVYIAKENGIKKFTYILSELAKQNITEKIKDFFKEFNKLTLNIIHANKYKG